MRIKTKRTLAALLAAGVLLLSGCGIRGTELSKRLIVEAVGIDRTADGVRITLEALDTHAAGKGSDPNAQGNVTKRLRFTGDTVGQALARIAPATGLTPLLSQTRVLVIGRAQAEAGLADVLDVFSREYNVRSDVLIAVAEDTAETVTAADPGASVPGASVLEDAITAGRNEGVGAAVPLYEFVNLMFSETDAAYCPVICVKDDPFSDAQMPALCGTAFFEGERLSFTADERLTRGALFLKNQIKEAYLTAPGAAGTYTLRTVSSRTEIRLKKTENGGVAVRLEIRTVCDVTEFIAYGNAENGGMDAADAAAAGNAYLEALIADTLETLFYGRHADLCRFQRLVRLKYPDAAAAYARTVFDPGSVTVQTRLTIRRTGKEGA